ncbi:unnamed protein product [Acanthoscelides obtectus]|uniref:Uncharacterized protein n=1 Tax=Acanthoscelides obtectus TaxID=200917 RepID=A0A9P0PZI7_ACAOB|nr:unnamed protein product [Acanthoscelides obtectus]CAK1671148.1 hypothetical protein AOBTE_LOCUS28088 [Acanthoscelides obtectus]
MTVKLWGQPNTADVPGIHGEPTVSPIGVYKKTEPSDHEEK